MPKTGLTVYDGEMIRLILIIYLERSSKMAVLGWCISNPENRPRQSLNAVRLALSEAEQYVREKDVRHLISIFGSRSLNRELERVGFFPGDSNIQQKYKFLR